MENITSLRTMEKACSRDINFKWLLESESKPSKSVIGAFIQENSRLIKNTFNQVVNHLYDIGESIYRWRKNRSQCQ